jgi:hypothetical protein
VYYTLYGKNAKWGKNKGKHSKIAIFPLQTRGGGNWVSLLIDERTTTPLCTQQREATLATDIQSPGRQPDPCRVKEGQKHGSNTPFRFDFSQQIYTFFAALRKHMTVGRALEHQCRR